MSEALLKSMTGKVSVKGGDIWYKVVGEKSNKPPLVTMHGGPGFPHNSLDVLAALADERQVIFYDQLGCGNSDRPEDKSLWTANRFVEEFGQLKESLGIDNYHLLGHSWGSFLAAKVAIEHPEGIQSLILSGPLLSVPRWEEDANRLKKELPENVQKAIEKNETEGTTSSQEYQGATDVFYHKHFCRIVPYPDPILETSKGKNLDVYETMWGPSEFYCTGNLKRQDLTPRVGEIQAPVLLSSGRYDEATPETVIYYAGLFKNAEAVETVVFEQSAHVPYVEEPELYVQRIRDFTNRHDPSKTLYKNSR